MGRYQGDGHDDYHRRRRTTITRRCTASNRRRRPAAFSLSREHFSLMLLGCHEHYTISLPLPLDCQQKWWPAAQIQFAPKRANKFCAAGFLHRRGDLSLREWSLTSLPLVPVRDVPILFPRFSQAFEESDSGRAHAPLPRAPLLFQQQQLRDHVDDSCGTRWWWREHGVRSVHGSVGGLHGGQGLL